MESTRLLLFKCAGGQLWIDHTPYHVHSGCLYVIPKGHFYFLRESLAQREVAYIDVEELDSFSSQTAFIYKLLLYRIKYTNRKLFIFEEDSNTIFDKLSDCTKDSTGQNLAALLHEWSRRYSGYDFSKPPSIHQVSRVQSFLSKMPVAMDQGCEADLANIIFDIPTSRNTLNRDCQNILGVSPGKVIMYHKISTAVFFLLSGTELTNNGIADAAGFGDVSIMYKKIRETTGLRPQEIRDLRWT